MLSYNLIPKPILKTKFKATMTTLVSVSDTEVSGEIIQSTDLPYACLTTV